MWVGGKVKNIKLKRWKLMILQNRWSSQSQKSNLSLLKRWKWLIKLYHILRKKVMLRKNCYSWKYTITSYCWWEFQNKQKTANIISSKPDKKEKNDNKFLWRKSPPHTHTKQTRSKWSITNCLKHIFKDVSVKISTNLLHLDLNAEDQKWQN